MEKAYDPLTYENLARNVVEALLNRPTLLLGDVPRFEGSGVYAIYYAGKLDFYERVASTEYRVPIYVGKADPAGGRKGEDQERSGTSDRQLHKRLREHAKSIEQARNLNLGDFRCRYLVLVPVWISLAERFLLDHFRPLWNTTIDGFGNHSPGGGRSGTKKPRWDILHPGRAWAESLAAVETQEDVMGYITSVSK